MFKLNINHIITFFTVVCGFFYVSLAMANSNGNSDSDEIQVYANVFGGEEWTNEIGSVQVKIKANGTWTPGGDNPIHSATGSPRQPAHPEKLVAPKLKAGALLMERENGSYEFIGRGGKFYIEEGETVNFLMNDYWDTYDNNTGCLNVFITPITK